LSSNFGKSSDLNLLSAIRFLNTPIMHPSGG
jgi:hypothetical protein